ncbi:hypothetical protein Pcinc_010779 [Petrolisthes cinctipes]|uniref:Uncharacterized protein n=1 Tax=Petrolisthes cinctipes TaxID=88211 RepID=A0AAE1G415_PETCI|nr:hypothetical protein Pcinc_010779 [Petrolisthes cinctipes]
MYQLPQEVKKEFEDGNIVVKRSVLYFNQVDPNQSQEWLGSIIGFINTQIAHDTRTAVGLPIHNDYIHIEKTKSRMKLDSKVEDSLFTVMDRFGLFTDNLTKISS